MKKYIIIIISLFLGFLNVSVFATNEKIPYTKVEIKLLMKKVADWQIKHQREVRHHPLDWTNATLYIGMAKWAELADKVDKDEKYYKWLVNVGNRYLWKANKRMYHADDLAVCQMFIDVYNRYKDKSMLKPTIERIDWIIDHPSKGSLIIDYANQTTLERWSWCDALFMAPPIFTRLYKETGNEKYLQFMDKEYKASTIFLYDLEEKMFFRDSRYFYQREANGKKVFWGRGNGWVLGGLTEMLKDLPKKNSYRNFYEELFVEMCGRMVEIQQPDGFWHASLLDPETYAAPETSCTNFIIYALTYGINEGLLDKATYLPTLLKSWKAVLGTIDSEGKLGYVQPIGADPKKVTKDMTEVYGVGAFLMAGTELYKMAE